MQRLLRNRPLTIAAGIALVFVLWLAFRPELLFVNKHVDDPFPTTAPAGHAAAFAPRAFV